MESPLSDFQDKYLAKLDELKLKYDYILKEEDKAKYLPKTRPASTESPLVQFEYCYTINVGIQYIIAASGNLVEGAKYCPTQYEILQTASGVNLDDIQHVLDKHGNLSQDIAVQFLGISPDFFDRMKQPGITFTNLMEDPEMKSFISNAESKNTYIS